MRKHSKIDAFPGYVEFPDFLTLPQVRAFEDSLNELSDLYALKSDSGRVWVSIIAEKRLPVILQCVTAWHIERVPDHPALETFPMTPVAAAGELIDWLFEEIRTLWIGEHPDPNA